MATTRKTTKTQTQTIEETAIPVVEKTQEQVEIEALKEQIAQMSKMMEQLTSNAKVETTNTTTVTQSRLMTNAYVPVISQTAGELNLATEGYGQGYVYKFEKFGEIMDIPFSDLKNIVMNNRRFTNEGFFYILDKQAVSELRLDKVYENLVSYDVLNTLFDKNADYVLEIYNMANKSQKETIENLIKDKVYNNENIDANIITKIEKISNKRLITPVE